ncbi:polyhydroxybutyrate depolymerase [Hamadaea flava]|uniref:PHB depolymerase family esterase n=1 Tax=Hamadaea flava TaxID=1742688 RepID=A0ABV8LFE3_9ACTN|nr:PHB depolymerase family esterase [Hamadaea flava]MCP2326364.1 polyhydroxybutyrate depolymerase [Hamadaea flava]
MRTIRATGAALGVLMVMAACDAKPEAAPPSPTPTVAASSASPSPRVPDVPRGGDQTISLDVGGQARTAQAHAPAGFKPGMPLVVAFHYYRSDVDTLRRMTRLDTKADQKGFIVVYPETIISGFNAMDCCGDYDDVGFVKALVAHMIEVWQVDRRRVYATGISNGADMTFRMAVEAPGLFAAIAPVSGGFTGWRATDPAFKPSEPVSVVTFIGGADNADVFNGGLAKWRSRVRCTASAKGVYAKAITWTRTHCADGSDVVDYQIGGMEHRWPGGTDVGLGSPETKINAVDVMWDFFVAHQLK